LREDCATVSSRDAKSRVFISGLKGATPWVSFCVRKDVRTMPAIVVVGAQWGDEGKGKITDILAARADVVVRYQGGSNAGHTVVLGDEEYKLHLIPSGILHSDCLCVMGDGTLIDPVVLAEEIRGLQERGHSCDNLRVSCNAHVIMPYHIRLDELQEQARGRASIGTTKRGIGPAYTDKTQRMPVPVRAHDLLDAAILRSRIEGQLAQKNPLIQSVYDGEPLDPEAVFEQVWSAAQVAAKYVADTRMLVHEKLAAGGTVVLEGAQGTYLDLDYGTYPFVTSSHPVAGGACLGTGIGPTAIDEILIVAKAYTTRVGSGPFPTEQTGALGEQLRERGHEFGTTTGRPRRCGWLDGVVLRSAARLNGATQVAVTKLDVLDELETIPVCVAYEHDGEPIETMPAWPEDLTDCKPVYEQLEGWQQPLGECRELSDLPPQARGYVEKIAELAGVPVSMVSVGPSREQTVFL